MFALKTLKKDIRRLFEYFKQLHTVIDEKAILDYTCPFGITLDLDINYG